MLSNCIASLTSIIKTVRTPYFNPYQADRSAVLNKAAFHSPYYNDTQYFKLLRGKQSGVIYYVRAKLYSSDNQKRYHPYDYRYLNRRKYLTHWPNLRHPMRRYDTFSHAVYAYKNGKKYKELS